MNVFSVKLHSHGQLTRLYTFQPDEKDSESLRILKRGEHLFPCRANARQMACIPFRPRGVANVISICGLPLPFQRQIACWRSNQQQPSFCIGSECLSPRELELIRQFPTRRQFLAFIQFCCSCLGEIDSTWTAMDGHQETHCWPHP
jgi:hypothetical protein